MEDVTFVVAVNMGVVLHLSLDPDQTLDRALVLKELEHRIADMSVEDMVNSIDLIAAHADSGREIAIKL